MRTPGCRPEPGINERAWLRGQPPDRAAQPPPVFVCDELGRAEGLREPERSASAVPAKDPRWDRVRKESLDCLRPRPARDENQDRLRCRLEDPDLSDP